MTKMTPVYLDYAAATPVSEEVLKAMQPYFNDIFYNPSATYLAARQAKAALESARAKIAQLLGSKPTEIIFTAGATEANNLALAGVKKRFPDSQLLISAIEHESVLAPAKKLGGRLISVDTKGVVRIDQMKKLISPNTSLISVILVNNEIGTLQPIRGIALLVKQIREERLSKGNKLPLYLHTDAAQAANWLDLQVSRLGVDLMTINSGKIYGPKQSGILYVKAGVQLEPLIIGGGQEMGIRAGTENVAGAIGLATALELAQQRKSAEVKRISELKTQFIEGIERIANAQINGSLKMSAPHIISVTFGGADNERLMMELDERGIQAAVGSACSASSDELSHVLKAIGLSDEQARSTLRFSFGRLTSQEDITKTLQTLKELLNG